MTAKYSTVRLKSYIGTKQKPINTRAAIMSITLPYSISKYESRRWCMFDYRSSLVIDVRWLGRFPCMALSVDTCACVYIYIYILYVCSSMCPICLCIYAGILIDTAANSFVYVYNVHCIYIYIYASTN